MRATGILTKSTKLFYKKDADYVDLGEDLMEFPDLGASAEQVDVTTLADSARRYINGIKDFGSLDFKFLYDGAAEQGAYKQLKALEEANEVVEFKIQLPDGIALGFKGFVSVTIAGGAVGDAMTFTLTINLNSDITPIVA